MKWRTFTAGCCLSLIAGLAPGFVPAARAQSAKDPIQIGMAQTMVVDVPQPLVDLLGYPFSALMKEFTGLNGKLEVGGSPLELAKKLEDGKVQLAVFQGLEYAWVHGKHSKIKPLMIVIYQYKQLHSQLIVRKDSGIDAFAQLRGKDVAYPKKSKEHCRVFLEKHCSDCGECAPKEFFGNLCRPGGAENALDQLVDGKCHAVIGDKVDVDFYQRLKPGAFDQLKVVTTSDAFPAAVITYRDGDLDVKTLERFRSGMLKANRSERGRDMMGMWRITSFEEIPGDYQRNLEDILRVYPTAELKN